MSGSTTSRGRGRGPARVLGLLLVSIIALNAGIGAADERDDAAAEAEATNARVTQLQQDLQGIDATLAQIYIDLDSLKQQIPVAEAAHVAAQERYDTANREHQVALEQLEVSEAELERLEEEVAEAQAKQAEATEAIGDIAREMYRNGTPSPMVLVMTAQGSQEIGDRAAAADVLARTQDQVLEQALNVESTQRNQVERQDAVNARITELENTARVAADEAEKAAAETKTALEDLNKLQAETQAKQAEWDGKKAEAAAQLESAEAAHREAAARLSELDAQAAQVLASGQAASGSSGFVSPLPVPLIVTSPFGPRLHPVLGYWRMHLGTDFAAACGVPVLSVADGVVSAVYWNESGGNMVFVNHGNYNGVAVSSAYLHLSAQSVSVGQWVGAGQQVGLVGTTGYSTGCHLHLSIMENGVDVDPMGYL